MTRVNLIPVNELTDQHLLAEHREIKRIPNCVKSWKYNLKDIPKEYTLWTWHIKFFYNKLHFLYIRYLLLYNECKKRNFEVQFYWNSFTDLPFELKSNFYPSKKEIDKSRERIESKIRSNKNFYRYYWKLLW